MEIIDWVVAGVTGLSGFFLGLRKTQKETDSISIQNVASTLNVYQEIIADLKSQIDEMRQKMEAMDKTIHKLQEENKKLNAMIKRNG